MNNIIKAYTQNYHNKDKFVDNFQAAIKILPFSSNPSSAYDKKCDLQGTTGEFLRLATRDTIQPIQSFEQSLALPLNKILEEKGIVKSSEKERFIEIIRDILYVNGKLNISDSSFLKFVPLIPESDNLTNAEKQRYKDGQGKIADYLMSILNGKEVHLSKSKKRDLISKIIDEALSSNQISKGSNIQKVNYHVLQFVCDMFYEDLTWLLGNDELVKIKYLKLLLYFYSCFSVTQSILNLNPKRLSTPEKPDELYFILSSEKTSLNHDAVTRGWTHKIQKEKLDKLYGKLQALDIANSIVGGNVGFYPEVFDALNKTPFEENKEELKELLALYQKEKREVLTKRESENDFFSKIEEIDTNVDSYNDFLIKLEKLCTDLQSLSYISRMRKKVHDLLNIRLIQCRRGNYVLVLDNEMLTFLIALITKGKKTKLEALYSGFKRYGICFNRATRSAIEDYLLKLNLLDRKSDSGEAQYVTVIL